jgi:hypothetical protein
LFQVLMHLALDSGRDIWATSVPLRFEITIGFIRISFRWLACP